MWPIAVLRLEDPGNQVTRVLLRSMGSLLLKRSATLKSHRIFINAKSFRSKAYYRDIKEMVLILALAFLPESVSVFTSCDS